MNRRKKSNREKILDTAERLFAARGSQAVSLREINTAAGVSQGVLHYQFGGRDGLIEALLDRRFPTITGHRNTLIQKIKDSETAPSYRQLIEVLLLPLAHLSLSEGKAGQRFLTMLDKLSRERNRAFLKIINRYFSELGDEFFALLQQVFPDSTQHEIQFRLLVIAYSMYIATAELAEPHWPWTQQANEIPVSPEDRLEMLLDMYCHGIASLGQASP